MAPRLARLPACTNCRDRHRSCPRNEGTIQCEECRRNDLDCDIQQKLVNLKQKSTKSKQTQPQPTLASDARLLRSQHDLPEPPSTDQRKRLLTGDLIIAIGLDLGSNYASASWTVVSDKLGVQSRDTVQHIPVSFSGQNEAIMEAAVFSRPDGQNSLIVGRDVQNLLHSDRLQREKVFTLPKLSLLNGNEDQVLGPRDINNTNLNKAHDHAAEVKRLHYQALNHVRGEEVHIPLRFDQTTYRIVSINSVVDIFEGVAAWLLDRIKIDIRDSLGYSVQDMSQIFSQSRVAAAVPEIWADRMVDNFRRILFKVGFQNVYIVSEPKCASVVIAHEVQQSLRRHNAETLPTALAEALRTIRIVFDLGAGTLDVCTTLIEEFEPKLKIRSIVRGSGSLWGSEQINEIFKGRIRAIIGESYDTIVSQMSGAGAFNEDLLLEPFVRGFERAKREFDHNVPDDLVIAFDSVQRLPPVPGVPALHGGALTLSSGEMTSILEEYLDGMYGPIEEQIARLNAENLVPPGTPVELRCVGGGSKSEYLRADLMKNVRKATVMNHARHDGSMVAKGAMLMAVDPELGHHDFARTAYGTAYTIRYNAKQHKGVDIIPANEFCPYPQVANRIYWAILVGENTREPPKPMVVQGEVEWAEEELKWPIDPEMVLWKTEDKEIGNTDDVDVNAPGVFYAGTLFMDIHKHEHAFELQEGENGERFLKIQTRGIAVREGLRFYWIFVVHKTGVFPNENLTEFNDKDYLYKRLELDEVLEYGALKVGRS